MDSFYLFCAHPVKSVYTTIMCPQMFPSNYYPKANNDATYAKIIARIEMSFQPSLFNFFCKGYKGS